MLPPSRRLDPNGYYARLGLDPTASAQAISAAFRRKALLLHPDVPGTGDTAAFVAVRHAYEMLSNAAQRADYDREAREAEARAFAPIKRPTVDNTRTFSEPAWAGADIFEYRSPSPPDSEPLRQLRSYNITLFAWLGVGALLCFGVVQAALNLRAPPSVADAGIRPNAPPVEPLSAAAQHAVLYGPAPVRLAGVPNFYTLPNASPTVLWSQDTEHEGYKQIGLLPPFSSVQAIRVSRPTGMVEVRYDQESTAFIDSQRLTPGDASAARRAYCGYNAGPAPIDGEVLDQRGHGSGAIHIDNRTVQPAVVKLRDRAGAVVFSVFLGPGGHSDLAGLPDGDFQAEFAIGELWSRGCNTFAAGMRAREVLGRLVTTAGPTLVLPSGDDPAVVDIADRDFER